MNFSQKKIIGIFCFGVFFLCAACTASENANQNDNAATAQQGNAAQQPIKDDAEELGKIIKLPLAPEEVTYRVEADGKKLTAVLKFSAADAAQIVAQAEQRGQSAPSDVDAEEWFPPELVAKSQETGDETLKGVSHDAQDFFQTPFTTGKLTRAGDTNYFVLELAAAAENGS